MAVDRIEREIVIDAPVEVVWRVLTEPEHVRGWFSDAATLDLRPGGAGELTFARKDPANPTLVQVQVQRVEPPHRFAFRWDHPAGEAAEENNSLLVEFSLERIDGDRTRLELIESGFAREPRQAQLDDHRVGWEACMERLVAYAPTQVGGAGRG